MNMYMKFKSKDAEWASRLHPNIKRVIRALEIIEINQQNHNRMKTFKRRK